MTFERTDGRIRYCLAEECAVRIHATSKPSEVIVNGNDIKNFKYDAGSRMVGLTILAGEGTIELR